MVLLFHGERGFPKKMTKINLLILADTLEAYGGAEKQILELVRNLDKNTFNLFVSSLIAGGELIREIEKSGARVKLFPVKRIYSIFGIIKGVQFSNFLQSNKIDILMTYHFSSDTWGAFWGKIAGVPVIISNRRDIGFWRKPRQIAAYRFINKRVNQIIVNSKAGKEMVVREENVRNNKIKIMYNGVDLERFKQPFNSDNSEKEAIRINLGIKNDDIVIGSVGNLHPVKGHKYLIEAVGRLIQEYSNIKLLIIGEGGERENLEESVKRLGIKNNVIFLGSRKDIPQLINILDICVQPSLSEGLSNSILEFMSAGKPIVATSVGGNPELIKHGINGILVKAADSSPLYEGIKDLLSNKGKAAMFGEAGRRIVEEKFSMPGMIKNYESFFKSFGSPALPPVKTECDNGFPKKRMKILHLISSNGFFGAENVLLNVCAGVNRNNAKVFVGAINNRQNPHLEVIEAAKRCGLDTVVINSKGKFDFSTVKQLTGFLKKEEIDLVHTHNYKSDIIGLFAARKRRIPVVATVHGFTRASFSVRLYEFLDLGVLRSFFSQLILVDESLMKYFSTQKSSVVKNAVDVQKFAQAGADNLRHEFRIDKDDFVIGTIGRLSPEKNQQLLIEAAKILIPKFPSLKIMIVGDGPLDEELKAKVKEYGLEEKIIFTGVRNDMPAVYRTLDVFALPSLTEGLPLVILEAFASGLPVIASMVGGVSHLIEHNQNGLLFRSQKLPEFVDNLEFLIENKEDRERFAHNGKKFVIENYSVEKLVNSYQRVYNEVVNK